VPVRYQGVQQKEAQMPTFDRGLRFATYEDFRALHPAKEVAAAEGRFFGQTLSGGMHSPFWTINGQVYPDADPLIVRNGERVKLSYSNHSMMPHPMHLHGHFFKVVNPALPRELWISKDTLIVDHMQRIEVEFIADNPGNWFHHCHNLYHMEAGMANVIRYQG
jgi:FtsP/CotA-like multicopper oxidase with cupredoxin domain